MSGPKHTPWTVDWPAMHYEIYVKDSRGRTIATVYVHGPDAKDNADFIAAGPRLTDALKEIAEWPNGGNRYGQKNIKEFARAALRESGLEEE